MSETAKARPILAKYCEGTGLDVGFGGDPIVPWAICVDQEQQYTNVGDHPAHIRCDASRLSTFFRGESLDFLYSSHLIEDFTYDDLRDFLINDWMRLVKCGGRVVLWAPDQPAYLALNAANGIPADDPRVNQAHKEPDFSLATFKSEVLTHYVGELEIEYETAPVVEGTDYCWGIVLKVL